MPIVNGPLTEHGAIVELLVGVHEARRDVLRRNNLPVPPRQRIRAQVDTGTTFTAVNARVLSFLALQSIDEVKVLTSSPVGGEQKFKQYAVSLGLEEEGIEFHLPEVLVIECVFDPSEGFEALLGQDVLRHCLFFYNGPQKTFTLSF